MMEEFAVNALMQASLESSKKTNLKENFIYITLCNLRKINAILC